MSLLIKSYAFPSKHYTHQSLFYSKKVIIQTMHPSFEAHIYPEVTYVICRLPLITLNRYSEVASLGDLMRLSVRSVMLAHATLVFNDEKSKPRPPVNIWELSPLQTHFANLFIFVGSKGLTRKENSNVAKPTSTSALKISCLKAA